MILLSVHTARQPKANYRRCNQEKIEFSLNADNDLVVPLLKG